jgi:DNA-binding transcriptional ArsR family regulator
LERAVDGDREAAREVARSSFPEHPTWPVALSGILAMTSDALGELLVGVVADWEERVFRVLCQDLMAIADRDAHELSARAATERPEAVIEAATRGWDHAPEPGVTRVILSPSVVGRPWVTTADHGEARIFCYAVSDASIGAVAAGDPPDFLVRRLRALGDERRLRLLRRIAADRLTLNDLARELGLPKTTIHHHLAILRDAGLVHLRHDPVAPYSPWPRYGLRVEAIPGAFQALEAWIAPDPAPED